MIIIMYAKIRVKNWATFYEIDPSKEPKIKSVAQFILSSCQTEASHGWFYYVLSSANANPSKPTGISNRRPPANIKQTINAGRAITKSIVANTFVRLHAPVGDAQFQHVRPQDADRWVHHQGRLHRAEKVSCRCQQDCHKHQPRLPPYQQHRARL